MCDVTTRCQTLGVFSENYRKRATVPTLNVNISESEAVFPLKFVLAFHFNTPGDSLDNNGNANPRCGDVFSVATENKKSVHCKPRKTGRYVNVRLAGKGHILTLCEVSVYSESKGGPCALHELVLEASGRQSAIRSRSQLYWSRTCLGVAAKP